MRATLAFVYVPGAAARGPPGTVRGEPEGRCIFGGALRRLVRSLSTERPTALSTPLSVSRAWCGLSPAAVDRPDSGVALETSGGGACLLALGFALDPPDAEGRPPERTGAGDLRPPPPPPPRRDAVLAAFRAAWRLPPAGREREPVDPPPDAPPDPGDSAALGVLVFGSGPAAMGEGPLPGASLGALAGPGVETLSGPLSGPGVVAGPLPSVASWPPPGDVSGVGAVAPWSPAVSRGPFAEPASGLSACLSLPFSAPESASFPPLRSGAPASGFLAL